MLTNIIFIIKIYIIIKTVLWQPNELELYQLYMYT